MATLEDIVAASKILSEEPDPVIKGSGEKNQDGASELRNGDGISAADAVVSERNMEIETVVAASEILSEDSGPIIGGSGCKPQEIQDGASEVRNGDGISAADVVNERSEEIETVVAASEILSEDGNPVIGGSGSKPQENRDVASEVRNGGVSSVDAVVSEQNMEIETVVTVPEILSEDPNPVIGGSRSKPQDNRDRDSEVRNDDVVSAADAAVIERNMEIETVVVPTLDDEKEKLGIKSLSLATHNNSQSVGVNDVIKGVDADDSKEELDTGENNEFADNSKEELVSGENNEFLEEGKSTDYMDVDGHGDGDGDGDGEEGTDDKLKDSENVFHVGDFVWAKIRSHPWWPGQVYDSKDASEFAMKRKQEGRLLVAFFGDGTCSWCSPSQLIPFVENFSEMSTDSSSKSFLNAVEKALDEVGRFVESEITCKCISKEKKDARARPVVENAGLKAGVVVPEIDADRLSLPKLEPNDVLDEVMRLAKTVSISSALNVTIIKSLLSAFYYYKGGYQLPVFHGPIHIEGLEDRNRNVNEAGNDFSVPIEVPILRPQDDDWFSSPAGGSIGPSGPVENKVSHKRKQKSVAELMGENKNIKPKSRKKISAKEGADTEKSLSSQKKMTPKNDGEVGSGGASSNGKRGRKRKVEEILESPTLTNVKDSNADTSGANGVSGRPLLRKPKGIEVAVAENDSSEAKEEMEIVTSPRERKKSKYLSPPYTNVAWRMGISSPRTDPQVEHDKTTKITQVGEGQKEAMEDIFDSQPISKLVENASLGKRSNGKIERRNDSEDKSPDEVKNDKKPSFPVSDVDAPVNELLSDIELASRDPFYLTKKGSLEKVRAFASALRSSTNLHGENYEILGKRKASKVAKTGKRSNTSNSKKAAETCVGGSNMESAERAPSPCLILQFTTEFPLPSKKDIVKLFDKFGSINKKETKVDKDSHSIRVVYAKDSDAEAAFKSSLTQSPFASESVNYRLQRSSPVPRKRRSRLNVSSPPKRAPEASGPTDELVSDFYTIRQKLEITTAIVENYHGKFSSEDRSSLKDGMKRLLEEVETISEKVRVMAEKTHLKE